ncbi:membrane-spanning 4-domains subfamily A member 4A-like [Aquarana catesbeiana]|uniref:membrane-spanning 4-domains subfamily A member 4A-like n=1 Tax=Aquarana catesbeiana TaxID=8400 RepID=UPI003CCA0BA5
MSTTSPDAESSVTFHHAQSHPAQMMDRQPFPTGVTNLPKPLVDFYKGEPEALGATQIFVGVMSIIFGIFISINSRAHSRYVDLVMYSGVMFWSGIAYIASGSVSVAAAAKPTVGKVKSSLVMNTITAILAGTSVILFSFNFIPYYSEYRTFCLYNEQKKTCEGRFVPGDFMTGILSTQFFFVVLMFTITISSAVFACKTLCRSSFQEVTVVVYQTLQPPTDPMDTKALSSVPAPSGDISGI